jgi:hypothetical protein
MDITKLISNTEQYSNIKANTTFKESKDINSENTALKTNGHKNLSTESVDISQDGKDISSALIFLEQGNKNGSLAPYLISPDKEPDFFSSSGNIYDFLKIDDRIELAKAYEFSLNNNGDLDLVEEAAFYLAVDRRREGLVLNGVDYAIHTPSENAGKYIPLNKNVEYTVETDEISNQFDTLRERFESGSLFKDNSYLNQDLFLNPIKKYLESVY